MQDHGDHGLDTDLVASLELIKIMQSKVSKICTLQFKCWTFRLSSVFIFSSCPKTIPPDTMRFLVIAELLNRLTVK